MIKNYLKIAWRNLVRNRINSIINIVGLSLGLACAMLIMLYVMDEVSFDRFQKNADQQYRIVRKIVNPDKSVLATDGYTGLFQGPRFTAKIPAIASYVRIQPKQRDIKVGNDIMSEELHFVDANFLKDFSFPLLSGDPATALLSPNQLVITESEAKRLFAAQSSGLQAANQAIGKTIYVKENNQFFPYIVSGVVKDAPQNSTIQFQFLVPFMASKADLQNEEAWIDAFLNTFVTLKPGADPKKVEAMMQAVYESEGEVALKILSEKYGVKSRTAYLLQPLPAMHLSKDYVVENGLTRASNPVFSYVLSGIALFILLIACINFVNLSIARSIKRAKEIGIRKVIGSDRRQLIMQFLSESYILCAMAFLLACGLLKLSLPFFNQLANKHLEIAYLVNAKLLLGYVLLFLMTGFLSGFYPALVLSGYQPVQVLYGRFAMVGKSYLQKSLVVLQFALASFLIVATLTIFGQFHFLINEKLGYDDKNLVYIERRGMELNEAALFRDELLKDQSILGVSIKNRGQTNTSARTNEQTQISFIYETIDEHFLPLLNLDLVSGRNFSKEFPSDTTQSVLVNESFVKEAGWKQPIGQQLDFWYNPGEKYTVVGVVKDYHPEPLNIKMRPQLFTMKPANDHGRIYIKLKPNAVSAGMMSIEKTFKRLFPGSPFSYRFKEEDNRQSYSSEAKWKQIMLFGAILTIFISCIGMFGLSVLSAEKRTKEIGIRKVLGASVSGLVRIMSLEFLKLVILSLFIAMPVSWMAGNKWLENYPYRITLSWWMFAVAGALVILISLMTISYQAIRAAMANPVVSLKAE